MSKTDMATATEKPKSNNIIVALTNVRACFVKLAQPEETASGKKWSVALVIDDRKGAPKKANVKKCLEAIDAIRAAHFNGQKKTSPLHKGDEKNYDGYGPGTYYMNVSSYVNPPQIVDNRKRPADGADDQMFYSGARVNAVVKFYPQFSKKLPNGASTIDRVNVALDTVMFAGHDERLSGKPVDVDKYFEAVDVEEGEPFVSESEEEEEFEI